MDNHIFNQTAVKTKTPKIQFDPTDYVEYLDGMDLTDAEAKEVLSVLWDMMVQFVDLGFKLETGSQNTNGNQMKSRRFKPPALDADSTNTINKKTTNIEENRP